MFLRKLVTAAPLLIAGCYFLPSFAAGFALIAVLFDNLGMDVAEGGVESGATIV